MTEKVVPDILTPCCNESIIIVTEFIGGYMGSDVPSEVLCAGVNCYNSWSPKGESDKYNKIPIKVTKESN